MFGWGQVHGQQTFQKQYRCFSMELAPKNVPDTVKYGGKIFLPVSALEILANLNIVYPMLFELRNNQENITTHCGVLEFIAEEGRVYIPNWMMTQLRLKNGDILQVKSATVPLGRFVKIQPQHESFLEITNPRAVLETALRNFACLSVGDIVEIKYNAKVIGLKVLEAKPANAISIIEADVEVDFAPPPGYVDPAKKKVEAEEDSAMQMDEEIPEEVGFVPFSGGGQSLNGKQRTGSPISDPRSRSPPVSTPLSSSVGVARSASPKQASPFGSMSGRSPSPRQPSPFSNFASTNAAPMVVPAGKLVFGKTSGPSPSPSSSSLSSSLNGSKPSTPAPPATPLPTSGSSSGFVAFSGAGRSLK